MSTQVFSQYTGAAVLFLFWNDMSFK